VITYYIKKIIKKLIKPFYLSLDDMVVEIDLDSFNKNKLALNENLKLQYCEKNMLKEVETQFGFIVSNEFKGRLDESRGYFAVLKSKPSEVIAWAWSCDKLRKDEGARGFHYDVHPKKGSVYIFDVMSVPTKRNIGAMTFLLSKILEDNLQQGFKKAFLTHNKQNKAMEKITSKLGFSNVGQISYRRLFGNETKDIKNLLRCTQ